jgi:hypothetical protein
MPETASRLLLPAALILAGLTALVFILSSSSSSSGYTYVGALLGIGVLAIALSNFRRFFFPLLISSFLLAGIIVPFHQAFTIARWGVLFTGAVVGFMLYMKDSRHSFTGFHLVGLFAVIAGLVSALVSAYPRIALLKTASLFLVFLYAAAGGRLAVQGREVKFFFGLLRGCEALVYIAAIFYFVFRFPLFGNPNSLGLVVGVVCLPTLLWGVIVSENTRSYKRRIFAVVVCVTLLFSSYARAALGGASIATILICVPLRRTRLLVKGVGLALLAAMAVMVIAPLKGTSSTGIVDRLTDSYLYKGKREEGVFGSRQSPWDATAKSVRAHPWFGTGFGTSVTAVEAEEHDLSFSSIAGATREHGNSYLAIAEWTGLLGVAPFYLLVLFTAINVGRVFLWVSRTRNPFSPAVPTAAIVAGALFHATFEDWMFAAGYYLCVFFWVFAFLLVDMVPNLENSSRWNSVSEGQALQAPEQAYDGMACQR